MSAVLEFSRYPAAASKCAVEPQGEVHLALRNVTKSYRRRSAATLTALSDVSLDIKRNEFLSLIGPSGCGKSTILKLLAGLTATTSGTIERRMSGQTSWGGTAVGYVFQSPVLLPWKSVLSNVLFPATVDKRNRGEALQKARSLLSMTGLSEFETAFPYQLSGGMQQRAAICRALMCSSEVLLMDEPFGALDALTRDGLMTDLKALCEIDRRTVVFVTHNISEAVYLSDRVVVMSPRPGRISADFDISIDRSAGLASMETSDFQGVVAAIRRCIEHHGNAPPH